MASDGNGGNEIRIDRTGANKIQLWIDVSTQITSIGSVSLNSWSHVAITRSGSTVSIYINGALDSTATFGTALNFSTCPLMIGVDVDSACTGGLSDYWNGGIDDVRVYNTALTLSDIKSIASTKQVAGVTGSTLWLRADAGVTGTSTVTAWADQSDYDNAVTVV